MNSSTPEISDVVPERAIGPGSVGYAYLESENQRRVGLCVRRGARGNVRLVFDVLVNVQRQSNLFGRMTRMEVALENLPSQIDLLIGLEHWLQMRVDAAHQSVAQRREFLPKGVTSTWKGSLVSVLDFEARLRWPVTANWPSGPPELGVSTRRLAIWHGSQSVCVVNPSWLVSPKEGRTLPILSSDTEFTYFFPGVLHAP